MLLVFMKPCVESESFVFKVETIAKEKLLANP